MFLHFYAPHNQLAKESQGSYIPEPPSRPLRANYCLIKSSVCFVDLSVSSLNCFCKETRTDVNRKSQPMVAYLQSLHSLRYLLNRAHFINDLHKNSLLIFKVSKGWGGLKQDLGPCLIWRKYSTNRDCEVEDWLEVKYLWNNTRVDSEWVVHNRDSLSTLIWGQFSGLPFGQSFWAFSYLVWLRALPSVHIHPSPKINSILRVSGKLAAWQWE